MREQLNRGMEGISFIVNTYNHALTIRGCLEGVLSQRCDAKPREIIVVDDGSTDGTLSLVDVLAKDLPGVQWQVFEFMRAGGVACRQYGFDHASFEFVVLLGGDFILSDPTVVARMQERLVKSVPFVSLYGPHGGMGTLYRRSAVMNVGGFNLAFNRFGSGYRDDSDLHYRLVKIGLSGEYLPEFKASYRHEQRREPGLVGAIAYALHRVAIHQLDVLLFRLHPSQFAKDFRLLAWRIVDPVGDFNRATGRWRPGGRLELSSPQGIVLVSGETLVGRTVAVLGGLAYVLSVHAARLWGSVIYRTILL